MKTGVIYIIKNKINDKVYVGQTTSPINQRFNQHCRRNQWIKEIGREHFYIEILESDIPQEQLEQKEIEYITKYNSYNNGYNKTKGYLGGRKLNNNDEKYVISMFKKQIPLNKIAQHFGVHKYTIIRVLQRNNIDYEIWNRKYTTFDDEKFKKLWFDKNTTRKEMSVIFNVDCRTLKRHANRLNLPRKS